MMLYGAVHNRLRAVLVIIVRNDESSISACNTRCKT